MRLGGSFSVDWHSKSVLLGLLALAFVIRLFGFDIPVTHWRQADTAAIARNFHEQRYALAFPEIDWGGRTGYVESEFPAYPFAVSLVYGAAGFGERYGRLLSAFIWTLGIALLYLLVRRMVDRDTALWASLYHGILPLSLFFSRAFMPESTMVACLIASVYFFSRWLSTERWPHFFAASIFTTAAILVKLPSLYIGLPLLYLAWLKFGRRTLLEPAMWSFAILVLTPPLVWYAHAHSLFTQYGSTFGIWDYGSGKWGNWGLVFSLDYWNQILLQSIANKHFALFGFPVFLAGLSLRRRTAAERVFDVWLVALLVYLLVVGQGNFFHEYYQLPVMIPAVVFAGKAHARLMAFPPFRTPVSFALAVCFVGASVVSLARHRSELRNETGTAQQLSQNCRILARQTDYDDLVLFVQRDHDPSFLYVCDRKGWLAMPSELTPDFIDEKVRRGANYVFGTYENVDAFLAWTHTLEHPGFFLEPVDEGDYVLLKVSR